MNKTILHTYICIYMHIYIFTYRQYESAQAKHQKCPPQQRIDGEMIPTLAAATTNQIHHQRRRRSSNQPLPFQRGNSTRQNKVQQQQQQQQTVVLPLGPFLLRDKNNHRHHDPTTRITTATVHPTGKPTPNEIHPYPPPARSIMIHKRGWPNDKPK